ncbi:MAG: DUF4199 domain-containing protein [Prevotella sp.]|nr:DUF4199 domain-containing protein [Prevotella sp.]
MTPTDYIQLKAFARADGLWLALLWIASFAFYILGLATPGYSLAALLLAFATPILVWKRLKNFRDYGLEGHISFLRAWAYIIMSFFYGSLLFAIAQFCYFNFMDQGYLLAMYAKMMELPENAEVIKQAGMQQMVDEALNRLGSLRPIDLSLNLLTTNMMMGVVMGLPIAGLLQRKASVNS